MGEIVVDARFKKGKLRDMNQQVSRNFAFTDITAGK